MENSNTPIAQDLADISAKLVAARREASVLPEFPGTVPTTLADAYAIQDHSRAAWGDDVAGWKVGGIPEPLRAALKDERLVGPIFRKTVVQAADGGPTQMPAFGGSVAIECEFIFQTGEVPDQDRLFVGIEIASSPITAIHNFGPLAIVSDFGNNAGLLLGPEVPDWQTRSLAPLTIETIIDGEVVGTRTLDDVPGDGVAALAFLREHLAKRGIELPTGTYVSSGAITGVHDTHNTAASHVQFGDLGTVKVQLVPIAPAS